MARRGIVRGVSWVLMLLPAVCAGCSASGRPEFVKFDPSGRLLLYQDAFHPRVYVYYLQTRKKHVFGGEVACVDAGVTRFVLRSRETPSPMRCSLVRLSVDEPVVEPLPPLPSRPSAGEPPSVVIAFGPGPDTLVAVVYHGLYRKTLAGYYTLRPGQEAWKAEAVPDDLKGKFHWEWFSPVGIRDSGFVYAPIYSPPAVPKGQVSGVNVEQVLDERGLFYRLRSPDGRFIVTVYDPDDRWKRLILTEAATGRRTVLIDKNDAARDFFMFLVELPGKIILTLLGVNF